MKATDLTWYEWMQWQKTWMSPKSFITNFDDKREMIQSLRPKEDANEMMSSTYNNKYIVSCHYDR